MNLIRLTADYALTSFDCGDNDLNEFLLEDAKHFLEKSGSMWGLANRLSVSLP